MKFLKFLLILLVLVAFLVIVGEFLSSELGVKPIVKLVTYLVLLGLFVCITWIGKTRYNKNNLYKISLVLTILFITYLLLSGVLLLIDTCPGSKYEKNPLENLMGIPSELANQPVYTSYFYFFCPFSLTY